ncbi:glycosyltransferase family 2 protein [Treponema medium]|nr:glycosyltransferase family 2 protein [Treponema medium]QSH92437.1 glycosyltransferase family 2 protein [Treponema medium]
MSFLQRCAVRFGRAAQQKPLVSLCVPVYGTEGLVERFLDSVLAQKDALYSCAGVNPPAYPIRLQLPRQTKR